MATTDGEGLDRCRIRLSEALFGAGASGPPDAAEAGRAAVAASTEARGLATAGCTQDVVQTGPFRPSAAPAGYHPMKATYLP
jgi:hypothetical protein